MNRMNTLGALGALLLSIAGPTSPTALVAQAAPSGWTWRADPPVRPAASAESFSFEPMAPGWHVTMGPGAILYGEREQVSGRFALEAVMILFPEPTEAEYGVFVGGAALDGDEARWIAFVVRGDGSAAVLRHASGRTEPLLPWTKFAAVVARGSAGNARNVVTVRAEPDSVRFVVNDIVVQSFARSALPLDGHFGLRIGRGVNIHVTNLDVTRRLAPYPRR